MTHKDVILYFAYGSNMSTTRLQERVPDARPVGIAVLKDYEFKCNKKSVDGSSKGNLSPRKDAFTWGVIFEIPCEAISILDRLEGGYSRISISVSYGGIDFDCETYISRKFSIEPPYDWYMNHIIQGAREHGLPDGYIHALSQIKGKEDMKETK